VNPVQGEISTQNESVKARETLKKGKKQFPKDEVARTTGV